MADRAYTDDANPGFGFLLIDAFAFLLRNRLVFLIAALPIAGFAAGISYMFAVDQQFVEYRNHLGWDFLFALIYAMFLDRWIKETLLDEATPCESVDELRRSIVSVRFLFLVVVVFGLATALGMLRFEGVADKLEDWRLPHALAVVLGPVATWLPHLFVAVSAFTAFALLLPALSANEPAKVFAGRTRGALFALIFGAGLLSLLAQGAAVWGLELLPKKPWAGAAMVGATRLFDCVLLAFIGYGLATLWRGLTGWQPPEPEDRPYRGIGRNARRA